MSVRKACCEIVAR